jgi:ethanolamine transporter EutH
VAGVSTFASILEATGVPDYVGGWAAGLGSAALGALVLCYVGGVVLALACSTALLPIIIPLIVAGDVSAVALVAALAVSSTSSMSARSRRTVR